MHKAPQTVSLSCSSNPPYELVEAKSNNYTPYKAVSYAWGYPENASYLSIVQNDRQGWSNVPVRLQAALKTPKDETEDIFVWADSVC